MVEILFPTNYTWLFFIRSLYCCKNYMLALFSREANFSWRWNTCGRLRTRRRSRSAIGAAWSTTPLLSPCDEQTCRSDFWNCYHKNSWPISIYHHTSRHICSIFSWPAIGPSASDTIALEPGAGLGFGIVAVAVRASSSKRSYQQCRRSGHIIYLSITHFVVGRSTARRRIIYCKSVASTW